MSRTRSASGGLHEPSEALSRNDYPELRDGANIHNLSIVRRVERICATAGYACPASLLGIAFVRVPDQPDFRHFATALAFAGSPFQFQVSAGGFGRNRERLEAASPRR